MTRRYSTASSNKEGMLGQRPFLFVGRLVCFRLSLLIVLLLGSESLWANGARAAPFRPSDDAIVLEQLPVTWSDAETRALQKLQGDLRNNPENLELALKLAKDYINRGRAEADPRYYGYAQAALAPWWNMASPPVSVLVLRATFRQNAHDFTNALSDLSLALKADPDNPQALITRATILQVQGRYPEAKQGCLPLLRLTSELAASTCIAGVASLNGEAVKSYNLLQASLTRAAGISPDEKIWALTILAEIAGRVGWADVAEQHFKEALALGIRDTYLLTAYSDFLLDHNQPEKVISLLKEETRADGLVLRMAQAKKKAGASGVSSDIAILRARFDAARMRGDNRHLREEAIFTLHLLNQPQKALSYAVTNWDIQKEPMDARILLEAAVAANGDQAARPVLRWMRETGIEDVYLTQLAGQLK